MKKKAEGGAGRQKRRCEVTETKGAESFGEEGASTWRLGAAALTVLACYLVSPVFLLRAVEALLPDTTGKKN